MPYYGALQHPMFEPAISDIIAITNANPAVVTTGTIVRSNPPTQTPHHYLSGLIIRMIIPQLYGMRIDPQVTFTITVISSTTFSIPLNTANFDVFIIPTELPGQPETNPAQVIPVGEVAAQLTQSFVNILTPQF